MCHAICRLINRSTVSIILAVATVANFAPGVVARAQEKNAVTSALRTMFSPRRAPANRTMGLTQRTFLDLVEESRPQLEVAIVIDGTESMQPALAGLRDALTQMMRDLELYKQHDVSYQLVVYRDVGAKSGVVVQPLRTPGNAFTTDRDAIVAALNDLTLESGAPYFPELVDEGVHHALTQLPWSTDENVSRWIFVFGDAPPFDPTVKEEGTGAGRRYATDTLVAIASEKRIHVNCVLCTTRDEDREAFNTVLDQTQAFMTALSSGTGGLMLDLSYDDIRDAITKAAAIDNVEYSQVGIISRDEVQQLRATVIEPPSPSDRPTKIVVLPHAPLDRMTFASDAAAMQMAAELRLRLKSVVGLMVVEPLIVERRFEQLRRSPNYSGLRGDGLLQALGATLGADYLVWGDIRENGDATYVRTRVYSAATGDVVAQAERSSSPTVAKQQLGGLLAADVLAASITSPAYRSLGDQLLVARNDTTQNEVITRQISNESAHDDLVAGLASLEKALAYPLGDAAGVDLLRDARERLARAAKADDANALPRFLLANCHYNRARQQIEAGEDPSATMKSFGSELRAAYRFRTTLPDSDLRREIEADYALLVRGKPAEAIPIYERLAEGFATSDTARRANWMLAGIYGNDWGVPAEFAEPEKARQRLIAILAIWPESPEAAFIKRALRWDDTRGGSQFPHLPRENDRLAAEVDRET